MGPWPGARHRRPRLRARALDEFLGATGPRALVLVRAARDRQDHAVGGGARRRRGERGLRVLSARPSGAEAALSFTALIDLLDAVGRRADGAARAAAQRARGGAAAAPTRGLARRSRARSRSGFLNALRALAADGPLLVAIDDVQWLDRRLRRRARVRRAPARRRAGRASCSPAAPARPSALERGARAGTLERLEVGPLGLGAIAPAPRRAARAEPAAAARCAGSSTPTARQPAVRARAGAHARASGPPALGEDFPVPDALEDMLGTRVARCRRHARGCCSRSR